MDRRHHRAIRLRHGARFDVARRPPGAPAAAHETWKPAEPAGFTLDGPRGPARVAQPGAVWLAKATGNPVLPFHLEADRCWTTNSWDRTQIPKPFATVSIAVGEPFEVPRRRRRTMGSRRRDSSWKRGCRRSKRAPCRWRQARDRRVTIRVCRCQRTRRSQRSRPSCSSPSRPRFRNCERSVGASSLAASRAGQVVSQAGDRTLDRLGLEQPPAVRAGAGSIRAAVSSLRAGALGGVPALRRPPVGRARDAVALRTTVTWRMSSAASRTSGVTCRASSNPRTAVTLGFLASDYGEHLRHHLAQVGVIV